MFQMLTSTSCAIKLGSENVDDMRNIIFDACIIHGTNRGLGIQNRDEDSIENVIFSNIIIESRLFADVWWGKSEPIYVTAFRRAPGTKYRFRNGRSQGDIGQVRNCRVSWGDNRPDYYGHAIESHDVNCLHVENFKGTAAHPEQDRPQHIVGEANKETGGGYTELTLR